MAIKEKIKREKHPATMAKVLQHLQMKKKKKRKKTLTNIKKRKGRR